MSTTISRKQATNPATTPARQVTSSGHMPWLDRVAKRALVRRLSGMADGVLQLIDTESMTPLGSGSRLMATLRVNNASFYRHAVLGGTLSVAESYLRGDWDSDDLTTMFRLFVRNIESTQSLNAGLSRITGLVNRAYHSWHANSRSGSRRNIHAHYDLGNEFFRLMLDETLAYSSGIFEDSRTTLKEASIEKMDRLCRMLQLAPDQHLLEIGTGWGGLAIHAASNYGCRVTTTTISQQQHDVAARRIADAGLSDRVTLLKQDYRDLIGQFDCVVSVEMIEAVGHAYLDGYFEKCAALLKPGGMFALQSIVMPNEGYARYLKSVDFIQRYVFPGGCLPCAASLDEAAVQRSRFDLLQSADFGPHYARTIREWRQRFHANLDEVHRLGYPPRFVRLWDYYLSYCEAAFDERYTGLLQQLYRKPINASSL